MAGDFEVKQSENLKEVNQIQGVGQIVLNRVRNLIPYLLIGLVVVATAFAVYFWNESNALKKNPQRAAQQETQKLIASVSKLIVLPEGETPTIATVTDPERLKDQPFFARAQTGDKVFIYTNSRKAILYSATLNKIIEVAPINIGQPQTQ